MLFSCPHPLSTSSNIIFKVKKEALTNTDHSKKSTKLSTKHCDSKTFCILKNIKIYRKVIFYIAWVF